MSDERREAIAEWLRDFLEEQGVHVRDDYLADKAAEVDRLTLMDTPEEPVAWCNTVTTPTGVYTEIWTNEERARTQRQEWADNGDPDATCTPLFAHPPRVEGEVVEGWVQQERDEPETYDFYTVPVAGYRRARLIIEQEGEDDP